MTKHQDKSDTDQESPRWKKLFGEKSDGMYSIITPNGKLVFHYGEVYGRKSSFYSLELYAKEAPAIIKFKAAWHTLDDSPEKTINYGDAQELLKYTHLFEEAEGLPESVKKVAVKLFLPVLEDICRNSF